MDNDPLLNKNEAAALLTISVPSLWRRVREGSVPKPLKLGATSRWPRSEIIEAIELAKKVRDKAA